MDYCVYCGSEIEETDELCPSCGAEILNRRPESMLFSEIDISELSDDDVSLTGTVLLPKGNSRDNRYSVLSSLGFMGSIVMLCLPVVGQLIALVWALGGCANRNRRNLARAVIYLQLIVIALCVGFYMYLNATAPSVLENIVDKLEYLVF